MTNNMEEFLSQDTIKRVLELTTVILNRIRKKLGEKKYNEFINGGEFKINGERVGSTLQEFLLSAIFREANNPKKDEYEAWYKEHFSTVKSFKADSPRGDWYEYASLYDGKIFAFGAEQGNYAGGHTVSMSYGGHEGLLRKKESCSKEELGSFARDLYEKIKDCPVMTDEEYKAMRSERMRWPREFDFWNWFD